MGAAAAVVEEEMARMNTRIPTAGHAELLTTRSLGGYEKQQTQERTGTDREQ